MASSRPTNVGICGLEVYLCRQKVDQKCLEEHDQVSSGKYTVGLGQEAMAVCAEWEDTASMSLTVVSALLRHYALTPSDIGRLEVGTETPLDRSKSIKTFLMPLFAASGNTDLPGVDCINACFGATQALFNAADWIESSAWDGRLAIVVASDVAIYAEGPARPTGGCGAVAMLIGPDAPLALERRNVAHHAEHVFDFHKPAGLYPQVDAKVQPSTLLSRQCGNMYTASLWGGLAGLVESQGAALEGRRLLLFSYGSGAIAAAFCMHGRRVAGKFSLDQMQTQVKLAQRSFAEIATADGDVA
ncbi:hypothetical protein WJX73_000126 [Symbiochloris irregularis]|uniref:Hydroxymethylglutaryl-CoA synthase n=1 Tax=Symbiochloris irregularis TaxID=706552 RepID=A0AAW1NLG1_9CHLO